VCAAHSSALGLLHMKFQHWKGGRQAAWSMAGYQRPEGV